MKILYIVTAAGFGGAPKNVLQLLEHMALKGHRVGLISAPERRLVVKAKAMGAVTFPNPHFVRSVTPHKDFLALWPVLSAVRRFDPDIIHAHSTKAGFAARIAGAIFRKPVVFTAHGWAFTEGKGAQLRVIFAAAEKLASRVTDKIICVSEHDRELALRWKVATPEQLIVIRNGVDPRKFLNISGKGIRKELGISNEEVIVSFVGRLSPPKKVDLFVDVVAAVKNCRAVIVGDGELKNVVSRKIDQLGLSKRVFLMGERTEIPEILAASDIFVLPSQWEGLPYTIIEAMMSGLPVVATKVGGIPELVEDGVTGFLVSPNNVDLLISAIRKLVEAPLLRMKMGKAARTKALENFTLERMLDETEQVYIEVLKDYG